MATIRDMQRLPGVHPTLVMSVLKVLTQLPMFVVSGVRTDAEQAALFAQGRTTPGAIVTKTDGVVLRSNHQIHPSDGLGHAVDCAWLGGDPFALTHDWTAYGVAGEALGLIWGGRWTTGPHPLIDRPHLELP